MADEIVHVRGLHKTYITGFRRKKVHAVRGISFDIRRGEILGIIGHNGAGKTTTLKVLTGLTRADEGEITIFGSEPSDIRSRERLGYMPENPYFYEHLSGPELLRFYGRLFGMRGKELHDRVGLLLERVGLNHAGDRAIKKFSKGMRQRVGIAQALINDPDLVILDEPQSGLDPIGRREVRELIVELRNEGKTILLSSHILPDVEAVCDRVVVMVDGVVAEEGTINQLTGDRVEAWEVIVKGAVGQLEPAPPWLTLMEPRGDYTMCLARGDASPNEIVQRLAADGLELFSLTPQRLDLEKVFVRDTEASREVAP